VSLSKHLPLLLKRFARDPATSACLGLAIARLSARCKLPDILPVSQQPPWNQFRADRSNLLKWTEISIQSLKEDFGYEPENSFPGEVERSIENGARSELRLWSLPGLSYVSLHKV
jgi:hypothetical protein